MTSRISTDATYTCAVPATPEETLAEEERRRTQGRGRGNRGRRADVPRRDARHPGQQRLPDAAPARHAALRARPRRGDGPGPIARVALFLDDHIATIVAARLITAIALGADRRGDRLPVPLDEGAQPAAQQDRARSRRSRGAVLSVIAGVVAAFSLAADVTAFADAARQTEEAARDALADSFTTGAVQLAGLGSAILGLGIALTALNAMRVGLLTRFMGVLGIIVGVLSFLPQLEGQLPFVKIFWLLGLGVLLLHRWPGGNPPAWTDRRGAALADAAGAARGADGGARRDRRPTPRAGEGAPPAARSRRARRRSPRPSRRAPSRTPPRRRRSASAAERRATGRGAVRCAHDDLRGSLCRAFLAGARALQHRRGRLRQAPARQARADPRGPRRHRPRGALGRAAGHGQPLRAAAARSTACNAATASRCSCRRRRRPPPRSSARGRSAASCCRCRSSTATTASATA